MLIDFTVENYRSIKGPVTLSAVAQPGRASSKAMPGKRHIKCDNEIAPSAPIIGRDFELLPVLAIFGANASGKSNVLRALDYLLGFMEGAGIDPKADRLQRFNPFELDETSCQSVSRFQIRFALDGNIFVYQLALGRLRIHHERLERVPQPPKRAPRAPLFERTWSEVNKEYTWSKGTMLGVAYRELQHSLRETEPFIYLLVRRLKVPSVEPLANWLLRRQLNLLANDRDRLAPYLLLCHPGALAEVEKLIRTFDTGIKSVEFDEINGPIDINKHVRVFVTHDTPQGPVRWSLEEESLGTRHLFALLLFVWFTLATGGLLTIDELDSSLHPHIVRRLVQMFQSAKTNPKRAQLLFTSHDNTLQRNNLLRRDQIWFTEKRQDGSTDLFSLSDFHLRNDLAIDKAYLDGRFGAVPNLGEDEDNDDGEAQLVGEAS